MNAFKSSSYAFAVMLAVGGAAAVGCGSDNNNNNNPPPADGGGGGGGDGDGGGGGGGDAGGKFQLTGEVSPVEGTAVTANCAEKSDGRPQGLCYSFYCGTNSNSINAEVASNAKCGSRAEVWYACDGEATRVTADCARDNATRPDARVQTKACIRRNSALDVIGDACLDCYLDSADCARINCLAECATTDNPACDTCRQEKGCTPGYYQCAGLPDPQ